MTRERRHTDGMQERHKEKAGQFEVSAAVGVKDLKTKGAAGCSKCPRAQRLKGTTARGSERVTGGFHVCGGHRSQIAVTQRSEGDTRSEADGERSPNTF